MDERSHVLVFAPNWLGDAVMALPAIADVRRAFGAGRLTVAARASVARLFHLVPGVDEVITLEWRGRAAAPGAFWRDRARLRRVRAGVALLLPNSFASALLAWSAGVPSRWGHATDGRRLLLSRAVARPAESMHQASYYQHLTSALGIPPGPLEPCVTVPETVRSEARHLLRSAGWDRERSLVVLAPGAAYGTAKRWLPQHYARLARDLATRCDAQCVLVGSAADSSTSMEIVAALPSEPSRDPIDLCGRTDLETLAGVMAEARACVSNDSGAMHLAAAAGVPLAAIFGPTNERETAPLPRRGIAAHVLINPVPCRPCMLRECPIDHPCMRDLPPERVFATVSRMLAGGRESFAEDSGSAP